MPREPAPPRPSLGLSLRNVGETLAICAPTVVDALAGRVTKQACDARLGRWSRRVVANARIRLETRGLEHAAGGPYVVMSNHQSHYDVPVLFVVLGANLRMVAKKELADIPLFGGAIRAAGFVIVDRGDRDAAIKSLDQAKGELATGLNVWIAPEGTRSRTGSLLPFKKGGFVLALDVGLPILPVSIQGTRDVLPVHAARSAGGAAVRVTVHPPVDVAPYAATTDRRAARDALLARVRATIAAGLEEGA